MKFFSHLFNRLLAFRIGAKDQQKPPLLSQQIMQAESDLARLETQRNRLFNKTIEHSKGIEPPPPTKHLASEYEFIPNTQFNDTELMQQSERAVAIIIEQLQRNSH
jgi:hypothetical protein